MPRRMSSAASERTLRSTTSNASVINRHGSFQEVNVHVKKDTFKGRVDFKNTLRQFNPKEDERSREWKRTEKYFFKE